MSASVLRFAVVCLCLLGLVLPCGAGDVKPGEILPADQAYDEAVPTPAGHLGFHVGERHLHHHELLGYLTAVAQASDRVTMAGYGRSHGGRQLALLTITSPRNHERLEEIRAAHLRLANPATAGEVDIASLPAVIYMGYGVHGNEASASNVAALVAYHLAAATGEAHDKLLDNVVMLLDPCLNPDGFERFANWVNNNRGAVANPDPNHREHRESWPGGRTNYYWFDLNRDWLPLAHPESRGRLEAYHSWKPNVVLDYHEMGSNSTYFFQPGVPARNNPLTPARTFELTRKIARYHARALDAVGALYYSEERFDDFYMGKGSTYPDLHGAVGILFEQASARGHVQDTENGPLSFAFAIRNHFVTSLSSLRATLDLRTELLEHKREFYRGSMALAAEDPVKGHLVTAPPGDAARLYHFLDVLERHDIRAHRVSDGAYVIPTAQPEYRFVRSLFETRTEFEENVFYDVSTWTLPLAYNLQHTSLKELESLPDDVFRAQDDFPAQSVTISPNDLAYVIDWRGYHAPAVLSQLLAAGVKVKVATREFTATLAGGEQEFGFGSILVPVTIQPDKRAQIAAIIAAAGERGVVVHPVPTGLTPHGIDLGSSYFEVVPEARLLLVVGDGVSQYEAGEVWHLLDQRFGIPVTLVETDRLAGVDLDDYTAVVLVSGSYGAVSDGGVERLTRYLSGGGTVVSIGSAASWLNAKEVVAVQFRTTDKDKKPDAKDGKDRNDDEKAEGDGGAAAGEPAAEPPAADQLKPYVDAELDAAFRLVRGSIFRTRVDGSHPVGYGTGGSVPVFRNHTMYLEVTENPYATPGVYEPRDALVSGYISDENLELVSGSGSVVVRQVGAGRAIIFAHNPNFRAFWYGTNRLFLNALFFGPLVRVPSVGD